MTGQPEPLVSRTRINRSDALELLQRAPLLELGRMAFDLKRDLYGDRVTFIHNRHVNPTNLCVNSCGFCDFSAKRGDDHAYVLDESQITFSLNDPALREVHIVGGLHPDWDFNRSLRLVRAIRAMFPDLWIKAFTAVEIAYFAGMESHGDTGLILDALKEAGVNQITGGGAEMLSDRLHQALYRDKIGPDEWMDLHALAHEKGIGSNATMLFGHIETDEEIVDCLLKLRDLQDKAPGFQSFIPLAYQPGRTELVPRQVSSLRSVRIVALSRLVLDNIPHIKAYLPTLQSETTAMALNAGADDLDGTLGKERIMQLAGSQSPAAMTREYLEQIARHAGQELAERDGLFQIVDEALRASEEP